MALNVTGYLRRISFQQDVALDHDTLARLHRKHVQSVPFENLDVYLGRTIRLDINRFYEKIVIHRRGGFCYELNGLFGALLQQLGFDVTMVSARVFDDDEFGKEFDHMALVVNLEQKWLLDVGFGELFLEPIRLQLDQKQSDPAGTYVIKTHDATYFRLEGAANDGPCEPKYLFTLIERELADYDEMCRYHQTDARSPFVQDGLRLCTLVTERGRITIRNDQFIETVDGKKSARKIASEKQYRQILKERFRIEIET